MYKGGQHNYVNTHCLLFEFVLFTLETTMVDLCSWYIIFTEKRPVASPPSETTAIRDNNNSDDATSGRMHPMTSYPIKSDRESPKDPHSGYASSFLTLTPPKAIGDSLDKDGGHYQHLNAHAQQLYSTNQNTGLNMGVVAS